MEDSTKEVHETFQEAEINLNRLIQEIERLKAWSCGRELSNSELFHAYFLEKFTQANLAVSHIFFFFFL